LSQLTCRASCGKINKESKSLFYAFDFDAAVAKVIAPSCLDSRTMRRY